MSLDLRQWSPQIEDSNYWAAQKWILFIYFSPMLSSYASAPHPWSNHQYSKLAHEQWTHHTWAVSTLSGLTHASALDSPQIGWLPVFLSAFNRNSLSSASLVTEWFIKAPEVSVKCKSLLWECSLLLSHALTPCKLQWGPACRPSCRPARRRARQVSWKRRSASIVIDLSMGLGFRPQRLFQMSPVSACQIGQNLPNLH